MDVQLTLLDHATLAWSADAASSVAFYGANVEHPTESMRDRGFVVRKTGDAVMYERPTAAEALTLSLMYRELAAQIDRANGRSPVLHAQLVQPGEISKAP